MGGNLILVEEPSKAEQFVAQMQWEQKPAGRDEIAVRICPLCKTDNFKFYVNRDRGLFHCKRCNKSGNLYQLRQHVGLTGQTVSVKDLAGGAGQKALPDFDAAHYRLLSPEHGQVVRDYLVCERRFTLDAIKRMKLGCWEKDGHQWLVIPYFDQTGKPVYYKARTIRPAEHYVGDHEELADGI
jgi:hypothetical protein